MAIQLARDLDGLDVFGALVQYPGSALARQLAMVASMYPLAAEIGPSRRHAVLSTALFAAFISVAAAVLAMMLAFGSPPALAQEAEEETGQSTEAAEDTASDSLGGQSLESAANDATASMWTFQLSLEGRTWKDEEGPNGQPRPEGNRDQMARF